MTGLGEEPRVEHRPRRRRPPRATRFLIGPTEFVQQGLSSFDLRDPYFLAVSLSWRKFFLLLVAAEIAINLLFAGLYSLQSNSIANQGAGGFLSAFFFSLETLATVGYGEMYPATIYAHVISGFEIVTGVTFTAIITGLLFVRFSKPRSRIRYAEHPVLTIHNGRPTLMLRIANERRSVLHDTQISLYALTRETSDEGQIHVVMVELPLLRPRLPGFVILHTLMHVIDDASPLKGIATPEGMAGMRFFLNITGRDPTVGQDVASLHTFDAPDIRFGMRYAEAVRNMDDLRIEADYTKLSDMVEDGFAARHPDMAS
jgi:inward rectifier potassium channel